MKLNPFSRKDAGQEVVPVRRGKYKKATFGTIADKILIKKMKQDPNFGLELAKKYRGLDSEKGQPQDIKQLLKQQVELKELISELTGGDKAPATANWWQTILSNVIDKNTLNMLIQMILSAKMSPEALKSMGIEVHPPQPQALPAQSEEKTTPLKLSVAKSAANDNDEFMGLLQSITKFTPEEAILEISKMEPELIPIVARQTYESLTKFLKSAKIDSEFEEIRQQLIGEQRKSWLEGIIKAAQTAQKQANKG
ncbi:MAG: hypothetical protein V1767_03580 [Chloroflexota bacterium]